MGTVLGRPWNPLLGTYFVYLRMAVYKSIFYWHDSFWDFNSYFSDNRMEIFEVNLEQKNLEIINITTFFLIVPNHFR